MSDTERILPGQRTRIDYADGTDLVVRVLNPDYLRWDLSRQKRGWPVGPEAPFLFATFLAWSAAKREGHFAGSYEEFTEQAIDITPIKQDEDQDAGDVIRPTRSVPEAG